MYPISKSGLLPYLSLQGPRNNDKNAANVPSNND